SNLDLWNFVEENDWQEESLYFGTKTAVGREGTAATEGALGPGQRRGRHGPAQEGGREEHELDALQPGQHRGALAARKRRRGSPTSPFLTEEIRHCGKWKIQSFTYKSFECVPTRINFLSLSGLFLEIKGEKTQSKTIMDLYQQGLEAGDDFTKSKSWSHAGPSSSQNNWMGVNRHVNTPLEDGVNRVNGMSFEETMGSVLRFLAQDEQYMDHLQHLQGTKTHEKGFLSSSDATQSADLAIQKQLPMPCDQNPDQSNRNHSEDERRGKKQQREREKEEEKEVEEEQEEEEERLVSKPLMDTLWATFKLNTCPTIGDRLSLAFEFNMTEKQIDQWFFKRRKKYNKEMKNRKYKKTLKSCLEELSFNSFDAT
ncbi:hypothetical protein HPG69_004092, partial [Diceros bicornis minor]